jgi:DNA-binding response OmpR family regulator
MMEQRAASPIAHRGCRVLVVEEDSLLASVTARLIQLAGGVAEATTEAGYALRRLREQSFDLVLVNLCLTHGDGAALVATARALQPDALIAVSNGILGQEDDLPPEGDLYVFMPYNLELLRGLVNTAMGRKGQRLKGA